MTFDELLNNPPACTSIREDTNIFEIRDNFQLYAHINSQLIIDNAPDYKPQVSILIPTYRRPHLLQQAIESALAQKTNVKFEVVIVDNEAQDKVMQLEVETVINRFKTKNLRYFRNQENIGMFGNWNRCIELARGAYISILNDDDLLKVDFLEKNFKFLTEDLIIDGVACQFNKIENGKEFHIFGEDTWLRRIDRSLFWLKNKRYLHKKDLIVGNRIPGTLGVLARKTSFVAIGGFNPSLYPAADYIFWIIYANHFKMALLNEVLCSYRWEVNESLRPEVAATFHYCNFHIRRQLISKAPAHQLLMEFMNNNISKITFNLQKPLKSGLKGKILKILVSIKLRVYMKAIHLLF